MKVWSDLYTQYLADSNYNQTALLAAVSTANFSAQYWSYIVATWELTNGPTGPKPTPSYCLIPLKKWIKIVCADIVGTLAGMRSGAALALLIPGLGLVAATTLAGVIGGAAASGVAASF